MYDLVTIGGVGGLILWALKYLFQKDREGVTRQFDTINEKLDRAMELHSHCRENLPLMYLSKADADRSFDRLEKKIDELKEEARRVDVDRRHRWSELAKVLHNCTGKPIFFGATDTKADYTTD